MLNVKDKKVLVLGLGVSGYSASKLLANEGAVVRVSECSENETILNFAETLIEQSVLIETGNHTKEFCSGVDLIVVSPGIDLEPLYSNGILRREISVIGELELGYHFCKAPIVAITGTNGKTTTTELIGSIFESSDRNIVVCGNIGNPLTGEVNNISEDCIAVVEVSSFQLETIKDFNPHIAVMLNVSDDHYDRHGNLEKYKEAKFKIFKNQSDKDWAILYSDFYNDQSIKNIKSKTLFYGGEDERTTVFNKTNSIRTNPAYDKQFFNSNTVEIKQDDMLLKGKHNLDNAACSLLVGRIMGVKDSEIIKKIENFKGLGHRFEKICDFDGVEFIDDSKATNIDASKKALGSVDKKVVLIAGGIDKGGDYKDAVPLVREKVKAIVVIGEASKKIHDAFIQDVPVVEASDMREAADKAFNIAEKGEIVMLSPMCSSFDMFTSYKHRGEVFQEEIKRIISGFECQGTGAV